MDSNGQRLDSNNVSECEDHYTQDKQLEENTACRYKTKLPKEAKRVETRSFKSWKVWTKVESREEPQPCLKNFHFIKQFVRQQM